MRLSHEFLLIAKFLLILHYNEFLFCNYVDCCTETHGINENLLKEQIKVLFCVIDSNWETVNSTLELNEIQFNQRNICSVFTFTSNSTIFLSDCTFLLRDTSNKSAINNLNSHLQLLNASLSIFSRSNALETFITSHATSLYDYQTFGTLSITSSTFTSFITANSFISSQAIACLTLQHNKFSNLTSVPCAEIDIPNYCHCTSVMESNHFNSVSNIFYGQIIRSINSQSCELSSFNNTFSSCSQNLYNGKKNVIYSKQIILKQSHEFDCDEWEDCICEKDTKGGGGINFCENIHGTLSVKNCQFKRCTSDASANTEALDSLNAKSFTERNGGAILVEHCASFYLNYTGIINCTSSHYGGGVCACNMIGNSFIQNSDLIGCKAISHGGGAYFDTMCDTYSPTQQLNLVLGCKFFNCICYGDKDTLGGSGGISSFTRSPSTYTTVFSVFSRCFGGTVGAIEWVLPVGAFESVKTVQDCSFNFNEAKYHIQSGTSTFTPNLLGDSIYPNDILLHDDDFFFNFSLPVLYSNSLSKEPRVALSFGRSRQRLVIHDEWLPFHSSSIEIDEVLGDSSEECGLEGFSPCNAIELGINQTKKFQCGAVTLMKGIFHVGTKGLKFDSKASKITGNFATDTILKTVYFQDNSEQIGIISISDTVSLLYFCISYDTTKNSSQHSYLIYCNPNSSLTLSFINIQPDTTLYEAFPLKKSLIRTDGGTLLIIGSIFQDLQFEGQSLFELNHNQNSGHIYLTLDRFNCTNIKNIRNGSVLFSAQSHFNVTVSNCEFCNFSSVGETKGGAFYANFSHDEDLAINQSSFTRCIISQQEYDTSTKSFSTDPTSSQLHDMSNKQSHRKCDCTLKNNQPKGRGGAMYLSMPSLLPLTQLPPLTFSSVKFRGNSAFEGHNIFIVMKNFERISSYWIEAFYEIEFPAEENGRSLFGCTSEDCEAGLNLYSIWIRKEKIAYVNGDPQRGKDWMMCSSEEQPCSTLLEAKSHFVSDNCDMKSIIIQNYISQNSHIDLGGYCIQKAENLSLSEFILSLNERTEEDCCISNINNPLCISGMSIMFSSNAPCNSVFHSENSIFSLYNGRFSERKDSSFSVDHFSSSQPFKNTGPKAKLTSELSYPSVSSFLIVVNGKCEITTFEIDKVNFQCSLIRCLFSEKQNSIDQVIFIGANFSNVHLNNGSILMIEPQNDITKNGEQDIGESDSFVRKIIMSRCTFLSVVSDSNFSAVFYPISLNSNDKYSFETSSNNSDCLMPFQKEKAFLPISLCITDCTFGLCYSRMAKKGGLFFVPIYRSSHLFFSNCRFCHCLEYESNSVFKQFNEKYQNKSSNELGCNTDSFARYINILFEQESQGRIFEKNCGLSSFMNIEHSNDLINYSTKSSFGVICYALCVEEAPNVQLDSIITIDHPSHAHGLFFIHAPSITSIANHSSFRFFKTADTILVHTLCATEKDDDLFVDILSSYWALDFTTKVFVSSDGTYDRKCGIQQTTACKLFRDAMDHLKVDKEVQVVVVNEVEILEQTSLQNAVVCSLNKRATLLINYNQKTENVKDTAVILSVGSLSIESIDVACSLQLMPDNIFSGAFLCVGGSLTLTNVTFRLSSKLEDAYRSESQQDQSLPSVLICSFCTSIHIIESQFVSIIRNGTGPSVLQHESTTNFDADLSISANNTMFYQCSSFECEGAVAHIEGKSSIIFEGCNFIGLLDQPKENSVLSTFKQSAINKTHENDCNITQFNQKPNEQSGMCEWESSMVYVFGSNSLDVINSNFSNSSLGALTVINTDSVEINDCCFFDNSPHFAAFPSVRRNAHIRGAKSCLLKNLKFPKDLIESGASSYGDNNDRIHSFLEEQLSPERQKFAPMWFKLEDTILEGNYPENHPFFFVPQLHRAVLQISKKGKHLKFYGDLLLPCQTQFLISIQKKASSSNFPSDVLFRSSFFTMHNNTRHTQNLIHPSTSPLVQSDRSEVTWTEVSATVLNESYATSDTDIIPFSSTTHELLVKMLVMETSNFSLETPTIVAQILYDDSDTSKDDNKSKVILIVCVCIGVVFTLGGGIIIVVGIVLRKRKIKKMKLSQSVIADYRPINADDFYFSGSANFPNRMLLSPLHRYYCYSLDSDSSTTNKHVMNRSSHKNRQTKLPTLPQDCQQPNMEED